MSLQRLNDLRAFKMIDWFTAAMGRDKPLEPDKLFSTLKGIQFEADSDVDDDEDDFDVSAAYSQLQRAMYSR